jgi:chaperone protein EcpD
MNKQIKRGMIAAMLVFGALASLAQASVVITGTRVVYPEHSREVNIRLTNNSEQPTLVQSWVDDGRTDSEPNQIEMPFVLTPPVFRMEPKKGQTLRLMFTGGDLPKDKESVYWLNVLEIPPKPQNAESRNLMQIAFRTRIKIFYRPKTLTEEPTDQLKQLSWRLVRAEDGKSMLLRVTNPSPYYISFGAVKIQSGGKDIELDPEMIPPQGSVDMSTPKKDLSVSGPAKVSYTALSDYGAGATEIVDIEH